MKENDYLKEELKIEIEILNVNCARHISLITSLHWLDCMTRTRLLILQHTHSLENNCLQDSSTYKWAAIF